MDSDAIRKLERVLGGGDYVVVKRTEAEALTACVGAPDLGGELSDSDREILIEVIKLYRGLSAIGALYRVAKSLAVGAGMLLAIGLFLRGKLPFNEMVKAVFG